MFFNILNVFSSTFEISPKRLIYSVKPCMRNDSLQLFRKQSVDREKQLSTVKNNFLESNSKINFYQWWKDRKAEMIFL